MIRKTPTPKVVKPAPTRFFSQPIVILVIVVAMLAGAVYLWFRGEARTERGVVTPTPEAIQQEVSTTIDRVARLISIKTDEQPYVATITDINLVKRANPFFYKDAEQGDKVLIWSDKAVIYSPTKDKLVAVASATPATAEPATGTTAQPSSAPSPTSTAGAIEQVTIEVRNGSGVPGRAAQLRDKLRAANFAVSRIGDARARQTSTLVIDTTGGLAPKALAKLLELTGGAVATLPDGEPRTQSEFLIITGSE